MSRMHRRHFLQLAGSSLAAIGLNHLDVFRQGQHFNQALAQTKGRKLALLVGINQYPSFISDLGGCLNDVRLQYELLVHRYGFDPQNIAIVSEASLNLPAKEIVTPPTRQAILDTFRRHLIDQAQPGDAVVFHYSGHGTYVQDPHPIDYGASDYLSFKTYQNFEGKNGALVPIDALEGTEKGEANIIMGSTIFLLTQALKTDNVTVILDSCYSGGGVRGNLVYRATLKKKAIPSKAERAFQTQLMVELGLDRKQVQAMRQAGIAKGIAMTSARANQTAAETTTAGFRSGIFTYLLSRYLWQTTTARPLKAAFVDLARITRSEADRFGGSQNPIYFAKPGTNLDKQPPYLVPAIAPAADAVVRDLKADGTLEFWLGGMTPRSLNQATSVFDLLDAQGNVLGQVQQTERDGLFGYGKPTTNLAVQPGMLMREQIRGIPTDITLRVGLHDSLGKETPLARQVLSSVDRVTVVAADGRTDADYLLGRFDETALVEVERQGLRDRADIQQIPRDSIGLFTNALEPLPTTFGSQYEELGRALEARLPARLKLLLASQALKTILNPASSALKVEVEVSSNRRGSIGVVQSSALDASTPQPQAQIAQMRIGEEMSLQVTNREDRSLYVAVIAIERDGDLYVYHPSHWQAAELEAELSPGENVTIPKPDDIFYLPVQGPTGHFEVLVIASTDQLRDTLQSLQRLSDRSLARGQLITFTENDERSRGSEASAFNLVKDILGDLDRNASAPYAQRPDQYSVNTKKLAAIAVTIEVVEA